MSDTNHKHYIPAHTLVVSVDYVEHEWAESLMERVMRAAATEIAAAKCPPCFTGDQRENWIRNSAAGLFRGWVRV